MKKFLYTLLAVATLGLAAGCQREQSVKEEGPAVDVAFNVSLKGLQTKAFSDGTQAKDLYVAVYANRTEGPVYMESLSTADQPDAFANGLTTTVKFRLVRGENYNIAFWAQAPNAPYTLDKAAGTLTVNTEGVANDEIRDAFYCVWSGTPSATPQDVELRRPFAQINVLTTVEDWSALQLSQIPFAGSSAKVTAPSVLNLITGEATAPKEYDLSFGAIDPEAINIPGYERAYKYVAMNYVLAGTRSTTDLSFSVYRAEQDPLASFDVPNIPYQRNWRTIVWGDIFTMEGEFNVTIDPAYEDGVDWPMDGIAQTLSLVPGSALAAAAQMDDNNIWHVSLKKDAKLDFTGIESDATGATVDYKSSNPEVGGFITNTAGEFTALKAGETTVTASFTADGYKPAAMTFVVTVTEDAPVTGDTAAPATFALDSNLGLENGTEMTVLTSGDVTLTPGKGTNNNAPKYYTTGDAVRFYGSNTLTVSGGEKLIKSVKFTYSQAPTADNPLNADSGDMTADWVTWTGSAKSVTFTVGGTTGHVRISKVEVNTESTTTTLYWIDPATPDNGTLEIDANEPWEFAEGTPIKVIATPATNYELSELYYTDENDGHKTDIDKQTLTFDMPGFNVLVYATFTEKTVQPTLYTVEFGDMEHGSVSLATPANGFAAGETVTLSVVPDDNYELDEETLTYNTEGVDDRNPITKDATGAYSFTMPASNVTVYARFKEKQNQTGIQTVTIAAFNAAAENVDQKYQLTGVITKITNTTYGNFTLLDATGSVIVYGLTATEQTWDKVNKKITNDKSFASLNLKEGDQVTLVGYRIDYNSAPEVAGAYYVSHVADYAPSITASDITGVAAAGVQNAAATVTIANLGNGSVTATPDGTVVTTASWVNDVLIYTVAANTGSARQGTITITATKDNLPITKEIKVSQLAGTTQLSEYDSNVELTLGANTTGGSLTVNNVAVNTFAKMGTGSKYGSVTFTISSGTKKITFYGVAWNGTTSANVKTTIGTDEYVHTVVANQGASGNSPFTLTVTDSDKYTITLDNAVSADTTVKMETYDGSGYRAIIFGVKASE